MHKDCLPPAREKDNGIRGGLEHTIESDQGLLTLVVRQVKRSARGRLPRDLEIPRRRHGEALRDLIIRCGPGKYGPPRKGIKTEAVIGSQISNLAADEKSGSNLR